VCEAIMLANSAIKSAYEKYHTTSRIPGNKNFVFNLLHKENIPSLSINHEEPVALFKVRKKKENVIQVCHSRVRRKAVS
jgi:rhodanese-related sulfurtransferase